ncbi:hypothetical protein [Alkalihalobacillus trypoxylicola]|uniref:Translation initiation factor 2 n=1 Tax=Alkalihalobacillus trypoxylicola TaxID=519424 RepID=A0A162D1H0_9BACI|nr:hypothetical protein [Alkalihalobacillus trypoxylicola]KYG27716.1 hypothetical protein AZF04_11040 [Alkalihalobacillus trypoxylicola]
MKNNDLRSNYPMNNVTNNYPINDVNDLNLDMSLKLAVVGGIITTIGDAIATYAASLAVNEAIESTITDRRESQEQEARLKQLENQINLLNQKIEQLTKSDK